MRTLTKPTLTRTGHWHFVDRADARRVGAQMQELEEHVRKSLVGVNIDDLWLEVPIRDGEWVAAYRVLSQNGTPVIGEVRLFPNERNRQNSGVWSGVLLGPKATVPAGGVTHRLLRELRVGHHLSEMGGILANIRRQGFEDDVLAGHGLAQAAPPAASGRRRGRKPFPDRFYAEVARDYVDAIERGSKRPTVEAARRLPLARRQRVRDILHEARQRELLTDPPRGRRQGGDLTPRARALLEAKEAHR
ncbi:MAG TPA: hypothetical protein VGL09_18870 [Methylomirabilota bacterium]